MSILASDTAVKASSFGFDPRDATECLQQAIDSGARRILVDPTGHEWLVRPIRLKGNQELIIGQDVTVRAKPGAYRSPYDSMFTAEGIDHLVLRGEPGAVLRMNRKDYWNLKEYPHSEWRNILSLRGVNHVEVRDLTFRESGGDGIYIAHCRRQPMSRHVRLANLVMRNNHRQGISVISAEDLVIENCQLLDTKGTPPQAGIDFEPNAPWQRLVRCVVRHCRLSGNATAGLLLHVGALDSTSDPLSIRVEDCVISDNLGGISMETSGLKESAGGEVLIRRCHVSNARGQTLKLHNLEATGMSVRLEDVTLDNRRNKLPPIAMSSVKNVDFGHLALERVRVLDDVSRPCVRVLGMGAAGITAVSGEVRLITAGKAERLLDWGALRKAYPSRPELKGFVTHPIDARHLVPIKMGHVVKTAPVRLRGANTFWQYVAPGGEVSLRFEAAPIRGVPQVPVTVKDCTGIVVDAFELGAQGRDYLLRSRNGGAHSFEIHSFTAAVSVYSSAPGQGFSAGAGRLSLFHGNPELYFTVPAGLEVVTIELYADEPAGCILLNGNGKLVGQIERLVHGCEFLRIRRQPSKVSEVWCLRLQGVAEDCGVRLGSPLLPIVSTSPGHCLIETTETRGMMP